MCIGMLIGIHGRPRVGKDAAYRIIKQEYGDSVSRIAFADQMKVSAAAALGIHENALEWINQLKNHGRIVVEFGDGEKVSVSGREFINRYGTEAHRDILNEDIWVDHLLPLDLDHRDRIVVVTDVRFANEAQRVKDLGGELWRIRRPETDIEVGDHPSAAMLPYTIMDRIIDNVSTPEHYEKLIREEMRQALIREVDRRMVVASYG